MGASCSVHFVLPSYNLWYLRNMLQVLLQYFEDRFESFYIEEPLSNYNELLDCVQKAIPVLQGERTNDELTVSIIQRCVIGNIYKYCQEWEFIFSRSFQKYFTFRIRPLPTCPYKITLSCSHKIRNELSNLLAQVATCSAQTVNPITNVAAEICKILIKRTSG